MQKKTSNSWKGVPCLYYKDPNFPRYWSPKILKEKQIAKGINCFVPQKEGYPVILTNGYEVILFSKDKDPWYYLDAWEDIFHTHNKKIKKRKNIYITPAKQAYIIYDDYSRKIYKARSLYVQLAVYLFRPLDLI